MLHEHIGSLGGTCEEDTAFVPILRMQTEGTRNVRPSCLAQSQLLTACVLPCFLRTSAFADQTTYLLCVCWGAHAQAVVLVAGHSLLSVLALAVI